MAVESPRREAETGKPLLLTRTGGLLLGGEHAAAHKVGDRAVGDHVAVAIGAQALLQGLQSRKDAEWRRLKTHRPEMQRFML